MAFEKVLVTKPFIARMKNANVRCGPIMPRDRPFTLKDWMAESCIAQGAGEIIPKEKKKPEAEING